MASTARRWLGSGLLLATGTAILAASLVLVVQTARYFSFDHRFAFLLERPILTSGRLWSTCFYLHIAGGILCLLTAPLLLWNGLKNGSRRLHRTLGRIHAVAALGWAGPTGLFLAPFAKGGVAGQLGFVLLGVWFYVTSLLGVLAIRRANVRLHIAWMVRSYALILSAVTFRAIHAALHALSVEAITSYVASTWASLALSILTGEALVRRFASTFASPVAMAAAIP